MQLVIQKRNSLTQRRGDRGGARHGARRPRRLCVNIFLVAANGRAGPFRAIGVIRELIPFHFK